LAYLALAGYGVFIVVAMMDAVLYNGLAILLLFIIPGFDTFAFAQPRIKNPSRYYPTIILVVGVVLFIIGLGRNILATYYANLGAVEMARLDLKGWSSDGTIEPQPAEKYTKAVDYFQKSLILDKENYTAYYRLGLLAVKQNDFQTGCPYLQKAYSMDIGHRGIRKNLGYCYVWLGDIDSAIIYLEDIPEASGELNTYSWWWKTQNREDLSDYASLALNRILSMQTKGNN
jgi:tetratricopeptide (TPR) repeat protein